MSQVITFEDFVPPPRFDGIAWTEAQIEEATTTDGPWTLIDTITLVPDLDPSTPASRSLTTELATDLPDLWYRVIFLDGSGDDTLPTVPIQNTISSPSPYATVSELAAILKIRTPTPAQSISMSRCLLAASGEVDSEIDRTTALAGWELALATEVTLERAVEHWQQAEAPFGIFSLGAGVGSTVAYTARDSWDRHAHKLAPLKAQWGIA